MSVFSKKLKKVAIPAIVAVVSTGLFAGAAQAAWSPKKPVEFIIMAGTGGGADQIARLLQGLIEKNAEWLKTTKLGQQFLNSVLATFISD